MSTTAKKPALTDTEKKIRMNEITDLIQKLGEAVIGKGFKITLKPEKHWKYIPNENVFEYDENSIYELSDRGIFGRLIDALGVAKFYTPPEASRVEAVFKSPGKLFMLMLNQLMALRSQELMIENHPGTYTILEYLFAKEDAEISGDVEKSLPQHMQYLYALPKLFWKKPISHFDREVIEALEKTESSLYDTLSIPDVNDAIDAWSRDIWDIFYSLYQEPPENPNGGGGGGGQQGQQGQQPLSNEEKQKLKDALEKGRNMSNLKQAMKDISQNKDGENDSKESFQADVEAEFDEKERKDQGGMSDAGGGETDDILDKAIEAESKGHGYNPANGRYYEKVPYENLYREIYHLIPGFKKKLASIMKDNLYNRQG